MILSLIITKSAQFFFHRVFWDVALSVLLKVELTTLPRGASEGGFERSGLFASLRRLGRSLETSATGDGLHICLQHPYWFARRSNPSEFLRILWGDLQSVFTHYSLLTISHYPELVERRCLPCRRFGGCWRPFGGRGWICLGRGGRGR